MTKVDTLIPIKDHTDRKCVHHEEVERCMGGTVNHIYNRCTYSVNEITEGKIVRKGARWSPKTSNGGQASACCRA